MVSDLATTKLKSGETARLIRLKTPDQGWRDRIVPLLAHKGEVWVWQIEQTLGCDVEPLESYYYLALLGEEVVANVCTFEHAGAGILGHVYTREQHRRKGACKAILEVLFDDFADRSGKALFLGTGPGSTAWHIYHSFGFRPVYPESGFMEFYAASIEDYESSFYASANVSVRPADWRDWAGATCLTSQRSGSPVRLVGSRAYDRTSMEGSYLEIIRGVRETGDVHASVLESCSTGATVGIAVLRPDNRFPGTAMLDVFVHPSFAERTQDLIGHLNPSIADAKGKVQAYAESKDEAKIAALEAAGFRAEGSFVGQMRLQSGRIDLVVLF